MNRYNQRLQSTILFWPRTRKLAEVPIWKSAGLVPEANATDHLSVIIQNPSVAFEVQRICAGSLTIQVEFGIKRGSNNYRRSRVHPSDGDGGNTMKKVFSATVGLIALGMAAPASAADLPVKAPPPVVAIYDWSGFYIGGNAGGGWSHKCLDVTNFRTVVPVVSEGCHDATGGLVGGQVGYRWQSASWVFGLEAQGDWANLRGSNVSNFIPVWTNNSKIEALGLFTAQIGLAWNNVLWYVKGGAAVTDDKYRGTVTATGALFDSANETRWGGAIGTGLEYGFAPNWSVAVEYDHLFMGRRDITTTSNGVLAGIPAGNIFRSDSIRQDVDMFTARINYRFGGPVVARY